MEDNNEITLQEIFSILWQKAWIIVLCVLVGGCASYSITRYVIAPEYTSKVTMYVNNNSKQTDAPVNINDINASQKLVNTYVEILKSEKVLSEVVKQTGLDYTTGNIREMMSAASVNGTEIFEIKVISGDSAHSALIANTIAKVAPSEIIRVVKAGSVELIDAAVEATVPSSPNVMLNTLIGVMLGGVLSVLGVLVGAMLDTRIKNEEELGKRYTLPVLGVIPEFNGEGQLTK